jgi:hypothetical protein
LLTLVMALWKQNGQFTYPGFSPNWLRGMTIGVTAAGTIFSGRGLNVLLSAVFEVTAGAGAITSRGRLRRLVLNVCIGTLHILFILGRTCLRNGRDVING